MIADRKTGAHEPKEIGPRRRILVIDDVAEISRMVTEVMRRFPVVPWKVTSETEPQRALGLVRSTPFDAIITDFRMPGCDGLQILAEARRVAPAGRRVLMTGYNDLPARQDRVTAAGVDALLQKPFHPEDLLHILRVIFGTDPAALEALRRATRTQLAEALIPDLGLASGPSVTRSAPGGT